MTLRRKNLASQGLLITIYGLTLFYGGIIAEPEFQRGSSGDSVHGGKNAIRAVAVLSNTVAVLRTGPRIPVIRILQDSKFLLWIAMYFVLENFIRPGLDKSLSPFGFYVVWGSYVALASLGYYRHTQEKSIQDKGTSEGSRAMRHLLLSLSFYVLWQIGTTAF